MHTGWGTCNNVQDVRKNIRKEKCQENYPFLQIQTGVLPHLDCSGQAYLLQCVALYLLYVCF